MECLLFVNTFLRPPPQTCFLTFGHVLRYNAVLWKVQNSYRFHRNWELERMGGGSRKRRCADEGSKPGVFGLLTARAVPWYLSNQPLLCSWGLSVSGFVGDQNQCGIVRGWKSMDKEGGQSCCGGKDRNTGSSFKKEDNCSHRELASKKPAGCVACLPFTTRFKHLL